MRVVHADTCWDPLAVDDRKIDGAQHTDDFAGPVDDGAAAGTTRSRNGVLQEDVPLPRSCFRFIFGGIEEGGQCRHAADL